MKADINSMLIWFPRIKDLNIPMPKTEIYEIPEDALANLQREDMKNLDMEAVKKVAAKIGYPLFLRTDQASGKHYWKRTCYVEKEEDLRIHVFEVVSFNLCADLFGLPFKALVFREFIEMDSKFVAFLGEMPVNPERRYFIKDGKILCHHAYWIPEAIEQGTVGQSWDKLPVGWRDILKKINTETPEEVKLLSSYANEIAEIFKGFWSIDFCKSKDGTWWLIDMAAGEKSWHYEKCEFSKMTNETDYLKRIKEEGG